MALALYRRYRPDTFDGVIGQDQVTVPLSRALDEGKLTHAYLFSGPRGCGKTSSARILARCINCVQGPTSHPCGECESCKDLATGGPGSIDVVEIDAASHNGVEDARELRERATFAPARDRYKIFILDEAHMVTQQGFNALLKIVEEPPEHVMFIFATTEPDKVIGTIRSRTHHYPFRLVPTEVMGPYLERICTDEHISADRGVLKLVMRAGGGSVRDTLSVLDQLMVGSVDGVIGHDAAVALLGFTPDELIGECVDAIIDRDGERLYGVIQKVVIGGFDPRRFVEDLLSRVRDLLVLRLAGENAQSVIGDDSVLEDMDELRRQSAALSLSSLTVIADAINNTLNTMTGAVSSRMRLELLAARLLAEREQQVFPQSKSAQAVQDNSTGDLPVTAQGFVANKGQLSAQHGSRPIGEPRGGFAGANHASKTGGFADAPGKMAAQRNNPQENPDQQAAGSPSRGAEQVDHLRQQALGENQESNRPVQTASEDHRSVDERWNAVVQALPSDVRECVEQDKVVHVGLSADSSGKQRLSMTFDRPLSQHAFALAVSSDEQHSGEQAAKVVLRTVRDVFGESTMIAPTQIAANGERVEPVKKLSVEQRAQVKRQIALAKAGLAQAGLNNVVAHPSAQPKEEKTDGAQDNDEADDPTHRVNGSAFSRSSQGDQIKTNGEPDDVNTGYASTDDAMQASVQQNGVSQSVEYRLSERQAGENQAVERQNAEQPTESQFAATAQPANGTEPAIRKFAFDYQGDDDPWMTPLPAPQAHGTNPGVSAQSQQHDGTDDISTPQEDGRHHAKKHIAVPDMSDESDPWAVPVAGGVGGLRDQQNSYDQQHEKPQGTQEGRQERGAYSASLSAIQSRVSNFANTGFTPITNQISNVQDPWGSVPNNNPSLKTPNLQHSHDQAVHQEPTSSPRVSAEDDEYSLNDESLGTVDALDLEAIEKMFDVKLVEEFSADDPKNPKNIQPANKHVE